MLALSVSISTSSSPRFTSSPSDLSHLRMVPSSIESDRRGIATSAMPGSVPLPGRKASARGALRGGLAAARAPGGDVARDGHDADHPGVPVADRSGADVELRAVVERPPELARLSLEDGPQQRLEPRRVAGLGGVAEGALLERLAPLRHCLHA